MPAWLIAITVKLIAAPVLAYLYWLLAIKGGDWIGSLLPKGKLRDALTKQRYGH